MKNFTKFTITLFSKIANFLIKDSNQRFSDVFRGVQKEINGIKWVREQLIDSTSFYYIMSMLLSK